MTDPLDIASANEQLARDIAINRQRKNAGLAGKTVADSAKFCHNEDCEVAIPQPRREAMPGCHYCIDCQQRTESVVR